MFIGTLGMQSDETPYKEIKMTFKSEKDFIALVTALRSGEAFQVVTPLR